MKTIATRFLRALAFSAFCIAGESAQAQEQLVQVQQDFSQDPRWEGFNNRNIGQNLPVKKQDFGWSATSHANQSGTGEIGGQIVPSRHQAYYAMPIGKPLTFKDKFSASGKLAVTDLKLRGVVYFGFFNSKRHEWRVYSSMAFRLWEEDMLGQVMVDFMTGDWQAAGMETDILFKPDGSVHEWRMDYDPDVKIDPTWKDPRLKKYLTESMQTEDEIFAKAKADQPDLTREALRKSLEQANDQGLVEYFHRHGYHRWWLRADIDDYHGVVTFTADGGRPFKLFMPKHMRAAPVEMDRFGMFNIQRYGEPIEVYFADLVVNGVKIDLSQDPGWEGKNNRVTYTEPDFQSLHKFGFTETNWAGKQIGEIGGLFWRTEPQDPNFAYYGDNVGKLTLDDPIAFSGTLNFVTGQTDAAMFFGYFNSDDQTKPAPPDVGGDLTVNNMLGIALADASSVGWYYNGMLHDADGNAVRGGRDPIRPTRQRRRFTFTYDPQANNNVGRATFTLDDKQYAFDLTPAQRKAGARFDRFGFANWRRGGNSVEIYLDDLSYTARRAKDQKSVQREPNPVTIPYPPGGRRY